MQFNHQVAMTDFGFNSEAKAPGFQPNHEHMPFVPVKKPYFFRKELLSPFMSWLYVPAGDSCLLVGPTGSGKSSIVEQTCARLAWPCKVSVHSKTSCHPADFRPRVTSHSTTRGYFHEKTPHRRTVASPNRSAA